MAEEQSTNKDQQESQTAPSKVTQTPIQPPVISQNQIPSLQSNKLKSTTDPASQPTIADVEADLRFVERETLRILREQLKTSRSNNQVAALAFLAALAAAVFVGSQVKIMFLSDSDYG